jgi:daunorubicin resistance ABC transporter ATP-binding subunit
VPPRNDEFAIEVCELHKHFGLTHALAGVDLAVHPGEVVGLLGPNGAGKTTLVRILATLLRPTKGTVRIFGTDAVQAPDVVREQISLTGQYAAVDDLLSGRENLMMFAELLGLTPAHARRRANDLLERFDLTAAADRPARQYSGGMRRRLDLASSLVVAPRLMFLDEPTTGLDPRTRTGMWEVIRELAAEGTTLLLTTQYLEEADQLADRIVVIDHGRIIADGTGDELKDRAGDVAVEVLLLHPSDCGRATRRLCAEGLSATVTEGPGAHLEVATTADDGLAVVQRVAAVLQSEGVRVKDLGLRRPTLDDVFLDLTGAGAGTAADAVGEGERQRAGGRGSE